MLRVEGSESLSNSQRSTLSAVNLGGHSSSMLSSVTRRPSVRVRMCCRVSALAQSSALESGLSTALTRVVLAAERRAARLAIPTTGVAVDDIAFS